MRAITPIIAIILLLLMTVAAAGAAYIWINMIQQQIAEQTQTGLEHDLKKMHGRISIESVWNSTPTKICTSLRNTGTISYSESDLMQLTFYIDNRAYKYNTTTVTGIGSLRSGDIVNVCLCGSSEVSSSNCVGPVSEGYDYDGSTIDVRVEVPVGTGDSYPNFSG